MSGKPNSWLRVALLCTLLVPALLILTSCGAHRARALTMTVLDVGQGDSIVLESPSGHTVVIDGGGQIESMRHMDEGGASDPGERVVVPFLRARGINRVDIVVLTHPHGDHVGGLRAVLRDENVGVVLDGQVQPYPSEAYAQFRQEIADEHIRAIKAMRGMRIDLGDGVTMDVLNPPPGTPYGIGTDDTTVNDDSIVLRVSYGKTRLMLDGDAEVEAEDNMLAAYPASYLRANVLKCGHHGSRNASSDEWLDAVSPKIGVISCGLHNRFGHPHEESLERLSAHGVTLYRTDLDGAVTITDDGSHIAATSMIPPDRATEWVPGSR